MFLGLSEENFENAFKRINFFCMASGSKISPSKSNVLGWSIDPPDWLASKGWQWSGPNQIARYLGFPFSVEPNLDNMWDWVYGKINKKHLKWQTHSLSFAGRLQVVQKVLSSHHIFFCFSLDVS